MKIVRFLLLLCLCVGLFLTVSTLNWRRDQSIINLEIGSAAVAADQTVPGAGNSTSAKIAYNSPLVQSAYSFLVKQARSLQDFQLRRATLDGVGNLSTCVTHRANLTVAQKQVIVNQLLQEGLVNSNDGNSINGGIYAGIFPPLLDDADNNNKCPRFPQPFYSAPGSATGSHHSFPGGLPVHEAFNDLSSISFANNYREIYGQTNRNGLPIINPGSRFTDITIKDDLIIAAPLWHDWSKPMVFQWNADGSEFTELNFGGAGTNDNNGQPGDSRTGGHHIIGIAETMKRGLSPEFVITQASAHSAPTLGNEYKVVNWLRAGAIMATIDPVAKGYLTKDAQGNFRLPALRSLGDINLLTNGQTNLLAEYALHNLSDADFVLSIPVVSIDQVVLQAIAPQYGYTPTDLTVYNNKFRNPVLSYISAERLFLIYSNNGLSGVIAEVNKLRARNII